MSYAEVNLYIHPILKGLYSVCEQLDLSEAKLLIDYVNRKECKSAINFTDEKYLEVFLLHWLSELIIQSGEWSRVKSKRNVFCKVDAILAFLDANNKPKLAEQLRRMVVRFNFSSNNVTSIDRKKNVTDDDGQEGKQNANASPLDDQKRFNNHSENGSDDRYLVRYETAGYALIINQIEFYRDEFKRVSVVAKTEK